MPRMPGESGAGRVDDGLERQIAACNDELLAHARAKLHRYYPHLPRPSLDDRAEEATQAAWTRAIEKEGVGLCDSAPDNLNRLKIYVKYILLESMRARRLRVLTARDPDALDLVDRSVERDRVRADNIEHVQTLLRTLPARQRADVADHYELTSPEGAPQKRAGLRNIKSVKKSAARGIIRLQREHMRPNRHR